MSFWLRAASLPDRPPMAVNLLSIDVIFLGGHRGAVRSVQQFWGLRACARSAGAFRSAVGLVRLCMGGAGPARPLMRPRGVLFAASNGGAAQRTAVERRSANASEARRAAEEKRGGVGLTDKSAAGARRGATGAPLRLKIASGRQLDPVLPSGSSPGLLPTATQSSSAEIWTPPP